MVFPWFDITQYSPATRINTWMLALVSIGVAWTTVEHMIEQNRIRSEEKDPLEWAEKLRLNRNDLFLCQLRNGLLAMPIGIFTGELIYRKM